MYIFNFSLLFVLMELLLLIKLPYSCVLFVCVCFFFSTSACFVIGLWAVKFPGKKLN
jgi:hypothetical protein